jgi:hypothetical protein
VLSCEFRKSDTLASVSAMPGSPGMWSMNVFESTCDGEGDDLYDVPLLEIAEEDKRCFASALDLGKGSGRGC